MMRIACLAFFLLLPFGVFAHDVSPLERAGTDDYLRDEVGLSDTDLSTSVVTEKREAFPLLHNSEHGTDPLGDVLTRFGTTSPVHVTWGDLEQVDATQNQDGSWTFRAVTATDIPTLPSHQAQFLVMIDRDGDETNNDVAGVKGQVDAEFAITRTDEGWKTGFRWFNKEADFWAIDKKTAATFTQKGNVFSLTIPKDELPNGAPSWRIVFALAKDGDTQIDAVPGVGFPKPLPSSPAVTPTKTSPSIALWGIPFILIGAFLAWFGWKRRS